MQIQLVRIQMRVPEYGWTTQKVFHFLNFLVNAGLCHVELFIWLIWPISMLHFFHMLLNCMLYAVRSVIFLFRRDVQRFHPEVVIYLLLLV